MEIPLPDKRYVVLTSLQDLTFSFGFDPFLYLLPGHLQLQPCSQMLGYYLAEPEQQQVHAFFPVFLDGSHALSPCLGPFGSVQFNATVSPQLLRHYLQAVIGSLKEEGVQQLRIISYPGCYAPQQSALLCHTLLSLGFQICSSQLNHHIAVTSDPLPLRMHLSARRRLQKCLKAGFTFAELELEQLPEVHRFIGRCRAEKNQSISLTLGQLERQARLFPGRYKLFVVQAQQGEWAAATVAVEVNGAILYNFYPASPLAWNAYSPVVMLNDGLYQYCQRHGHQLLDLGISARPGEEHYPLLAFKQHLGGIISGKLTYSYSFSGDQPAAS